MARSWEEANPGAAPRLDAAYDECKAESTTGCLPCLVEDSEHL